MQKSTPADVLISLARAVSGGRNRIPAKVFAAAGKKVGLTNRDRLRWAINFVQEQTEQMTPGDWYNAQLEAGAFVHPDLALLEKESRSIPFSVALFLSVDAVKKAKDRLLSLIKAAANGSDISFDVSQLSVHVDGHGVSYRVKYIFGTGQEKQLESAQIEQAALRLAQLLSEHWGYVGLCDRKRHGCGRYFLKSRTDKEFCSKTCLNRSTTYRQRGKEPVP
jgi:hypothetical protein